VTKEGSEYRWQPRLDPTNIETALENFERQVNIFICNFTRLCSPENNPRTQSNKMTYFIYVIFCGAVITTDFTASNREINDY
jgi:hypothetical protein